MLVKLYRNYSQKIIPLLFIGSAILLILIHNDQSSTSHTEVTISPTVSPKATPQAFVIKKGEEIIYKKNLTTYGYEVVRWQDWLFYTEQNAEPESTTTIIGLNLHTGETKIVMQNDDKERQISELLVLNDTLYISFGGYFADGKLYWTKLPTLYTPQILVSMPNPKISQINNAYWVVGGEGDSCWHEGYYATFNPSINTIGPTITTHEGCRTEGEAFIGIDSKDRVVVAKHPIQADLSQVDTLYDLPPFANVVAVSSNTLERDTLLSEEKMPKNIVEIHFNAKKNSLILMGPEIYLFDISKNTLMHLASQKDYWVRSEITKWNDEEICISLWDKKNKTTMISHAFTDKMPDCTINPSPTIDYNQDEIDTTQKLIEELNLPDGYEATIIQG